MISSWWTQPWWYLFIGHFSTESLEHELLRTSSRLELGQNNIKPLRCVADLWWGCHWHSVSHRTAHASDTGEHVAFNEKYRNRLWLNQIISLVQVSFKSNCCFMCCRFVSQCECFAVVMSHLSSFGDVSGPFNAIFGWPRVQVYGASQVASRLLSLLLSSFRRGRWCITDSIFHVSPIWLSNGHLDQLNWTELMIQLDYHWNGLYLLFTCSPASHWQFPAKYSLSGQ